MLSAWAETALDGRSLRSTLLSVSGRPLQGTVRGGEGTDFPYLVYTDADGDLVLAVTDNRPVPEEEEEETGETGQNGEKKEEGWSCVSQDENIAEVLGVITQDNVAAAYLRPGTEAGTVLVYVRDSVSGTEITLEFQGDGSGTLLLLDHSLTIGHDG